MTPTPPPQSEPTNEQRARDLFSTYMEKAYELAEDDFPITLVKMLTEALDAAEQRENEACAKVVDRWGCMDMNDIGGCLRRLATAIRQRQDRGKP